jgi:hypothetical protein
VQFTGPCSLGQASEFITFSLSPGIHSTSSEITLVLY